MNISKNKFKSAYPSVRPQYGVWNGLVDTNVAEILASSGFDWVLIDGEHAPFDLRTIQLQLQAMNQFDTPVLVRSPHGDTHLIKQLLDAGVQSLLVPMVETAEQAADLYKAMQYPPKGVRGVGTALARAAQWNRVNNYFKTSGDEMCLIVQVESVKGIENLESIANTEGVDGVFIGPSDLAASMGFLGQADRIEVKTAVENALKAIRKAGKIAGVMVIGNKPLADHYADCGANMIAIAIDTLLLANAAKQAALAYTQVIDSQSNTKY
ncbi:MAG: aldolase/citrate lyase family protein [Saprospiraceae bacterium]|nr:aldolase/citrate lyase family protein [Saprospiraceae bacterium]